MKIKESVPQKIFHKCNVCFMVLMIVVTLYPFMYVLFASLSNATLLMAHQGPLWFPIAPNLEAYEAVLKNKMIFSGYRNTVIILAVSLMLNILLTSFGAYVLSRREIMIKKPLIIYIVFTMFFSGGLIPFYYVVTSLGMYDTLAAVILPSAINTFNLIILRTGFEGIPVSLEESAKLDGAGDLTILFKIMMPLTLPTIAVVILYYAVATWNAWFHAMIFIRTRSLYPLQLVLREILIGCDTSIMENGADLGEAQAVSETIQYAVIMVATMPVLMIYPFLQKYFVKGVLVGAVKG
ncbi:MAG: carbohydrate ABC transporter permease [Clostridia bacterium]|nr:carbohydrate ABC transporter permease [Clostridia bacterium]